MSILIVLSKCQDLFHLFLPEELYRTEDSLDLSFRRRPHLMPNCCYRFHRRHNTRNIMI